MYHMLKVIKKTLDIKIMLMHVGTIPVIIMMSVQITIYWTSVTDPSKYFFFQTKYGKTLLEYALEHLSYHVKPIAGVKNAMVPNIWKNFCASDGNVKMRFRIVSKNTKFSTLYTLKGPQLWDGEILQDEKNNWANFMCIKCKENIALTRTS